MPSRRHTIDLQHCAKCAQRRKNKKKKKKKVGKC